MGLKRVQRREDEPELKAGSSKENEELKAKETVLSYLALLAAGSIKNY